MDNGDWQIRNQGLIDTQRAKDRKRATILGTINVITAGYDRKLFN